MTQTATRPNRLPEVTTRAFERSHARPPRGRGGWIFQRSYSRDAYDDELYGEMRNFNGTYAEARAAARRAMSDAEFLAALP